MAENHPLLTRTEAAAMLRIRPQTLAIWAMGGKHIPYIKVGKAVRYRLAHLQAFLDRQTVGGDKT